MNSDGDGKVLVEYTVAGGLEGVQVCVFCVALGSECYGLRVHGEVVKAAGDRCT